MRNRPAIPKIATGLAVVLGTLAAPAALHAQEPAALGEIIVTARKRAENLQDVGVSVSALGNDELARRFDVDIQTLANAAPNVVIDDIQQDPAAPLRSRSAASARPTSRRTSTRPRASSSTACSSASTPGRC